MLDSLMLYQNKDGGFGNALYIDNYNPNTSVYQIYEAFRLLDITGFDKNSDEELYIDIINKAGNYLYNRCELKDNIWNPNIKSTIDYPHNIIFEDNSSTIFYNEIDDANYDNFYN